MTDEEIIKQKIENRETEIQMAYDNARFKLIELNHVIYETKHKIEDQERIIAICKRRAGELGVLNIL